MNVLDLGPVWLELIVVRLELGTKGCQMIDRSLMDGY